MTRGPYKGCLSSWHCDSDKVTMKFSTSHGSQLSLLDQNARQEEVKREWGLTLKYTRLLYTMQPAIPCASTSECKFAQQSSLESSSYSISFLGSFNFVTNIP